MRQPNARPARIARSTAARFNTGSAPGRPRHTGQTCEFGGAPNAVLQPQKILDAVSSCAWISRPTTGSKSTSSCLRTGGDDVVTDCGGEGVEILSEHQREFLRLRIVGGRIGPRVTRV